MKIIGITGRSGCGKSSATNFLREQGYPCIDADLVAREVLLPGSACIPQLQALFGADIADEHGQVRRRLLADRAFATPEGTAALTGVTQPEILRRIDAALTPRHRWKRCVPPRPPSLSTTARRNSCGRNCSSC